jgi:hypothetical protein
MQMVGPFFGADGGVTNGTPVGVACTSCYVINTVSFERCTEVRAPSRQTPSSTAFRGHGLLHFHSVGGSRAWVHGQSADGRCVYWAPRPGACHPQKVPPMFPEVGSLVWGQMGQEWFGGMGFEGLVLRRSSRNDPSPS